MNKAIIILCFLLISACSSVSKYGTGPIELTSEQQKGYESYLTLLKNKNSGEDWVFAISPTVSTATIGKAEGGMAGESHFRAQDGAIDLCNTNTPSKDCKIYDINGKIVWRFSEPSDRPLKTTPSKTEEDIYLGRKIELISDLTLFWGGKKKYTAKEGDILTIIRTKPCRSNKTINCWIVKHDKHGPGAMRVNKSLLIEN